MEESLYLRVFIRGEEAIEKFQKNFELSLLDLSTEYLKLLIKQFHRDYIQNKKELPDIPIIDNKGNDFKEIRTSLSGKSLDAFNEIKQSIQSIKVIKDSKEGKIETTVSGKKIQNTQIILYIINSLINEQ